MLCEKKVVPLRAKRMRKMEQVNKEIDVRAWVVRILRNWYWFALTTFLFGVYGVYNYMSTTYQFEVKSEIMLRGADHGDSFIQPELLNLLGMSGKKTIDNEIATLASRDVYTHLIKELGLQTEFRKKSGLCWVGQYPKSDLELICPSGFLDQLTERVVIEVKVRKSDYLVKVKYGDIGHSKHIVNSLEEPFETCAGILSFKVLSPEEVVDGAHYKIRLYSLTSATQKYKQNVVVAPLNRDATVIEISSVTDIPRRSKDFIQGLIDTYNANLVTDKNVIAENTASFIEERLQAVENELIQAEKDEIRYLEKYGYVDIDVEARLFLEEDMKYRQQMNDIETQIHMVDFLCDFLTNDVDKESLLPAIFVTPLSYSQQSEQTTSSKTYVPDVALMTAVDDYNALVLKRMRAVRAQEHAEQSIEQMDAELLVLRSNIMTTLRNLHNTLLISKQDLEGYFESASMYRKDLPDNVRTYDKMEREKNLKENLYLYMCKKREENAMLLASTMMPIKVISSPQIIPLLVAPKRSTILFLLVIGFMLPLGVMVLYDVLNNKVSALKDLEKRSKVPVVGVLAKGNAASTIVVRDGEHSAAAELFRTLRTNIRFMQPIDSQCPVILVTSGVNGEGKSYVATNFAISMSLLGKKVALVGLDIRQPMLDTYLDLSSPGCLTNYLSDNAYSLEDVVVSSSFKNLDVIPAGPIPPNPSELLQSERLDHLFAELRKQYDYVIIDTAPVAMVSDTFLLSRIADMTICVTRVKHTTYDLVNFMNQIHEQQRLPKMVAVLNGVDIKNVGYGYGTKSGKKSR